MAGTQLARGTVELKVEGRQDRQIPILRRDGVVVVLFLALTAVMTNPLVLHIADAVEDKQDGLLNTWIIAWVGHALVTNPLGLFDTNIFHPFTKTLAFSEILLPQGLLALPINLASGNTVLGHNLVLLFSFFLSAYAMYLLVYDLTKYRGAAFVAATIFAFNPYNLGNLAQVQLLSFGWIPLALLFLIRILRVEPNARHIRRKGLRDSILFAFLFSLQALSSVYYAFLAALAVALYLIWTLLYRRLNLGSYTTLAVRLVLSALIIGVLVIPMLLPYLQVQREQGFARSIQESEPFSASFKLYTEVSSENLLYGGLLAPRSPIANGCYPLDNLFPGIIALGLAIVGLGTRRREKWFFIMLLSLGFVLSLGPRLFLTPSLPTEITLPYRWLYDLIPFTHAFRAPVRFAALVMLALAVLAGLGVQCLSMSKTRVLGTIPGLLPILLVLFVGVEYLSLPAANQVPVPTDDAVPQYVRWLARQPHGVALELPMIEPACPLDLTPQYLSTYHWQDTPDGYSGFPLRERGGVAYEMQSFPGERAVSLLQALGVKYVVLHTDKLPQANAAASMQQDLAFVQQFGNDVVYEVSPRLWDQMALATQLNASVYLPQPAAPGHVYTAYLIVRNQAPRSYAIKPTQSLQVGWQFNSTPLQPERFESGQTTAHLPLVTTAVSVIPIRMVAPARAGDYRVLVSVRTDDFSFGNLGGDLRVANEEAAIETVLPASVDLAQSFKAAYAPGEKLAVHLEWNALNKIDAYYSVSVRVVDSQGNKVAAQDRQPVTETMLWKPGSTIPDEFELALPRDLPTGSYTVQVLMYQADVGVDALLLGDDFVPRRSIELGQFEVK